MIRETSYNGRPAYLESHSIPWWKEEEFLRKGYTINKTLPEGVGYWLMRFLGVAESRAVKFHRPHA